MTDQTNRAPVWRPDARTALKLMLYLGYGVLIIGAIALGLSFISIDRAARPYFGGASWAIPVLMDATIGILTFFSLVAELNKLRAPLARYSARALVALTVYANVAPQPSLYGKVLHGAPPVVWVLVVAVAEGLIRRLARLSDPREIEPFRKSLWLLRPFATWRLWRRARIEQIPTYREVVDLDAARAAVVGRLRLHHGRMWRSKAPLAERIALRLQGRDPAGVAAILTDHADTAALLAAPSGRSQAPAETGPDTASDSALRPLDPIVYRASERPVLPPFAAANALGFSFAPIVKALPSARFPESSENDPANAENDRDAAIRMRAQGLSIGVIADRLGRSKSWVHGVVTADPIPHANGSAT